MIPLHKYGYFMNIANLTAQQSKDPVTCVGTVIVNDRSIVVGTGYNGFPAGVAEKPEMWLKHRGTTEDKHLYVIHSEINAIFNSSAPVANCTMFVTHFPCSRCAAAIIQCRLKAVVARAPPNLAKVEYQASVSMLSDAGVGIIIMD
jgi:dCMP deaminase